MNLPVLDSTEKGHADLEFRIDDEMLREFARLSGDFSSLHMDPDFGRRSPFRRNIVHGILPVLFLPWTPLPEFEQNTWSLRKINARFLKPVYPGESLLLKVRLRGEPASEQQLDLEYRLYKKQTGALVTVGGASLVPSSEKEIAAKMESEEAGLVGQLEEKASTFDEIARGDSTSFPFRILPSHARRLARLIESGTGLINVPLPAGLQNWLSLSLFSTLIGMCLPGRQATFLDFQADFRQPLQFMQSYRLQAEVVFASQSTHSLVEQVSIGPEERGETLVSGKVMAGVNSPATQMPSLSELKGGAMQLGLEGKVVLVTGASRGIGETTAKLFALYGARVAVNYLHGEQDARRVVEEIKTNGGQALAVHADVADRNQVEQMMEVICRELGPVDVLVNNAVRDYKPSSFLELTWEEIQKDLDVVVRGAFNCCQEALANMVERGGGSIINLSSQAVEIPPEGQTKYVIAKSGLVGLTRSLAVEFAPKNIRINLVAPSFVETDLTSYISPVSREEIRQETPLGRYAEPLEVAKTILFLASSMSSFITGQTIWMTGGLPPFR